MALSQAPVAGNFPGMTLKAWGFLNGSDGSLIRGNNIASGSRSGVGSFSISFTANMSSAFYAVKVQLAGASYLNAGSGIGTVGACPIYCTTLSGSTFDPRWIYVEVYE